MSSVFKNFDDERILLIEEESDLTKKIKIIEGSAPEFLRRNPEVLRNIIKANKYKTGIEKIFDLVARHFMENDKIFQICLGGFISFLKEGDLEESKLDRIWNKHDVKDGLKYHKKIQHVIAGRLFDCI